MTNSNSNDRPVITSGITSGAATIPENRVRLLNRPKRDMTSPAGVPTARASVADITPIRRLFQAASIMPSLENSDTYHLNEKPVQTVTSFPSLNE